MEKNKFAPMLSAILTEIYEEAVVNNVDMNLNENRLQGVTQHIDKFRDLANLINKEKSWYREITKSVPEFLHNKILVYDTRDQRIVAMFQHMIVKWCFSYNDDKLHAVAIFCVPLLVELFDSSDPKLS